jgi:CheY-like chemotaxis protein
VGQVSLPADPHYAVLVVEDNADARETLRLLLELEGHRVEAAETGTEGLKMAATGGFDTALVDIGLPDLDGYQLAQQIRALPAGGRMFLVALTGYGQPDDRRRALAAGFDSHLVKPVDPDDLLKALGRR